MRGISSDSATRRSRVGTLLVLADVVVVVVVVVAAVAGDDVDVDDDDNDDDMCGSSCGEEDAMIRRL